MIKEKSLCWSLFKRSVTRDMFRSRTLCVAWRPEVSCPLQKCILAIFHNNRNHFRMCIFIGCIAIKKKQMCPQLFLIETF